jgi:hypothetical protein
MLYSRQTIKSRNPSNVFLGNKSNYIYTKTISLVGLGITTQYQLQDLSTEGCKIVPCATVIVGSPTLVFWDFKENHTANENSLLAADLYFSNFDIGNTFTVSNSSYSENTSSFDGTYTFVSYKNNMVVSTTGLTLIDGKYYNTKFDDNPSFKIGIPKFIPTDSKKFIIINNVLGSNSFLIHGITFGTILEIAETKFIVDSPIIEKGNKQYMTISAADQIVNPPLPVIYLSATTIINLYDRTDSNQKNTNIPTGGVAGDSMPSVSY